jgi:hypothetical protein
MPLRCRYDRYHESDESITKFQSRAGARQGNHDWLLARPTEAFHLPTLLEIAFFAGVVLGRRLNSTLIDSRDASMNCPTRNHQPVLCATQVLTNHPTTARHIFRLQLQHCCPLDSPSTPCAEAHTEDIRIARTSNVRTAPQCWPGCAVPSG